MTTLAAPVPAVERNGLSSFLAALTISRIGDALYLFTLPWIAYEITGSALVMGTLYAAEIIPVVIFGAIAGVWVDHHGLRRTMIASDIGRAVLVAAIPLLAWLDALRVGHLYVFAVALGLFTLVFDVSTTAAIPRLTSSNLTRANAWHQGTTQFAAIAGPAMAGVLISIVGPYSVMTIDAMSFAATLIVVMAQPALVQIEVRPGRRVLHDLHEGFRWMWNSGVIRTLAMQAAIGNFGFAMVSAVMLFYLRDTLGAPSFVAGATLAMLGAGGIIGSILIVPLERRFRRGVLYPPVLAVGLAGLMAMAAFRTTLAVAIGLPLLAACNMAWVVLSTSVRQESIPGPLLGRTLAISRVVSMASMPLGAAAGGLMAAAGAVRAVFLIGAATKVIEIVIALRSDMRRL